MIDDLAALTLYVPPFGIVFALMWLASLVIPFVRERVTSSRALVCVGCLNPDPDPDVMPNELAGR